MPSVLQQWIVDHLTLKMQSVLLASIRGHDGMPKEEQSKTITRSLRAVILRDADVAAGAASSKFTQDGLDYNELNKFTADLDHYSVHWLTHVTHAAEIIGFKHPNKEIANRWYFIYFSIVEALHFLPETEEHLNIRLADRPFGEVERNRYRETNPTLRIITQTVYKPAPPTVSRNSGYRG